VGLIVTERIKLIHSYSADRTTNAYNFFRKNKLIFRNAPMFVLGMLKMIQIKSWKRL
jgi:hypothetical protein